MKTALLIHNPSAGNAKHGKEEIIELIKKAGYSMEYISTDDGTAWTSFDPSQVDTIFLAGGDGTVHKLAMVLLERMTKTPVTIHLLPLGTANNIAKTLRISTVIDRHAVIREKSIKSFDCGKIKGVPKTKFFLESMGFGIFPQLIHEMKNSAKPEDIPSAELKQAVKVLLKIIKTFKPQKATIKADGIKIKGSFLLVEIMNIQYLGPNIKLAPQADPGDGFFDLVMIPEKGRDALEEYLKGSMEDSVEYESLEKFVKTIRVQHVKIKWGGTQMHVDDDLVDYNAGKNIKVDVLPDVLDFVQDI